MDFRLLQREFLNCKPPKFPSKACTCIKILPPFNECTAVVWWGMAHPLFPLHKPYCVVCDLVILSSVFFLFFSNWSWIKSNVQEDVAVVLEAMACALVSTFGDV
jgi:hypothetical protein